MSRTRCSGSRLTSATLIFSHTFHVSSLVSRIMQIEFEKEKRKRRKRRGTPMPLCHRRWHWLLPGTLQAPVRNGIRRVRARRLAHRVQFKFLNAHVVTCLIPFQRSISVLFPVFRRLPARHIRAEELKRKVICTVALQDTICTPRYWKRRPGKT
jgi:hypothetical protein